MTFDQLRSMAAGFQPAKLLLVALDLDLFTLLERQAASAAEVAAALDLDCRATEIVCNALVALELLEKRAGRYHNGAAAARWLASSSPDYRGEILRHLHNTWEDWDQLEGAWRSGRAQVARKDDHLPSTEDGVRHFILGMENVTRELAPQLAELLPLAERRTLLDVGGGPGNYALAFARRWPQLEVTHFDLPPTSAIAREFVAGKAGAERVTFRSGDFLVDPLGDGYDCIWASQIVHMLDEAGAAALLGRLGAALAPGGVLAIHDQLLEPDRTHPRAGAVFGVHMLVATRGGRTYSIAELERMLADLGLGEFQVLDYGAPSRVLLAVRPA